MARYTNFVLKCGTLLTGENQPLMGNWMVTSEIRTFCQNHCYNFPRLLTKEIQLSFDKRKCNYYWINEYIVFCCLLIYTWQITLGIVGFWHNYFPTWRHCNFPFRKHARPFTKHLEIFLTLNKFFSTHLKKKENV